MKSAPLTTILIVDDNHENRALARATLEDESYPSFMPPAGSERREPRSIRAASNLTSQQNTVGSARNKCPRVRITLPVHPFFDEEVVVLANRGQGGLRVELPDGRPTYLPLAWTNRGRQMWPAPSTQDGRTVRLTLAGLRALANWMASRQAGSQKLDSSKFATGQKVDSADRSTEKVGDGIARRRAATSTVVGKARAPRAGRTRRSRGDKRGAQ